MEDNQNYAMGFWTVKEGSVDEFLARWRDFIEWTRGNAPGFQKARLLRNQESDHRFVSYSTWDDAASQANWRSLPEFAKTLGAARELCDSFESHAYERAVAVE